MSNLPSGLMMNSLLHFQQGVPIDDLDIRPSQRRRLARVEHVYWQWIRNPFIDVFPMFKQLVKGKYADPQSEWRAAEKDKSLFDFVVDNVAPSSRRKDEVKVRYAAEQAIRIGAETDNAVALVKGGKLLADVAHLNQPESQQADMSKAMFLPPVVTVSAHEVDDTKEDLDDKQALAIMNKYGAHIDEKRRLIDEKVAVMESLNENENENEK